jgi:hypothetical protein
VILRAEVSKSRRGRLVPFDRQAAKALDRYFRIRGSHPHAALPWLWLGKRGRLTDSGILQVMERRGQRAGPVGEGLGHEIIEDRDALVHGVLLLPGGRLHLVESGADDDAPAEGVELKLAFSMLRVSRDDPAEQFLVSMLLETEPDLKDFSAPMAFPVFGRGRALYALVGKGINADTIHEACEFLIGPCSCQIKDLNPGADLLMAVAWDDLIEGRAVVDKELPPLTGFSGFADALAAAETDAEPADDRAASAGDGPADDEAKAAITPPADEAAAAAATSNPLGRNVLIVTLVALTIVIAGTAALTMRKG